MCTKTLDTRSHNNVMPRFSFGTSLRTVENRCMLGETWSERQRWTRWGYLRFQVCINSTVTLRYVRIPGFKVTVLRAQHGICNDRAHQDWLVLYP